MEELARLGVPDAEWRADALPLTGMRVIRGDDAVDMGYHYLETDVHATSDGELVAFHDTHLDRVTDLEGAIVDLPYSAVREARINGTDAVPLLTELLEEFPTTRLNIDIKADSALKTIPIVMLTSSREEQDLVESYELGVNAYVVKPVDFTEFMNAVRQIGVFWAVLNEPPPSRRMFA